MPLVLYNPDLYEYGKSEVGHTVTPITFATFFFLVVIVGGNAIFRRMNTTIRLRLDNTQLFRTIDVIRIDAVFTTLKISAQYCGLTIAINKLFLYVEIRSDFKM